MNLRRLGRMSVNELRSRSRQATYKWLDEVMPLFGPTGESRRWAHGVASEPEAALARFVHVTPRRFFPGATEVGAPGAFTARFPDDHAALLAAARRLMAGRFDLLGYTALDFGTPPDWHLDPVANTRAPLVHWRRINPLDPATVGDSKVIWELNRHQWLVTLAQAYQVTGDNRYAVAVFEAIDAWTVENPWGVGINWASSLEVALRLIAWCWALVLLRHAPALTPERFVQVHRLACAHAAHIERYPSYYFSPNTHLTGEALGLFYAGLVFADCPDAARWRDLGHQILVGEIRRQVMDDGGYFEQASCYHRYTIEIYLHFLLMASRNGIAVPPDVAQGVERMVEWLVSVSCPNHAVPAIGDADGGTLLPLVRRAPDDSRGVLALAATWFDRPDFGWAAGGPASELVWLTGTAGLVRFGQLGRRIPAWEPSRMFSSSGYAVMRSDWQTDAHQLILDVGPLGCPISGAHGHADLLSIQCVAFGEAYLVDPGTYCYTPDSKWRNHFRGTAAHNTIRIDGHDQAEPAGPFSWQMRPAARVLAWESTTTHDFVDATHDGYTRLTQPVTHRRRVLFVKPLGWVVVDDLTGPGDHALELRFHFSPRSVTLVDGWVRAQGRRGRGLWLRTLAPCPLSTEIREGQHDPIEGWVSPGYGVRQPAPVVIAGAFTSLPIRIATVILPVERIAADPPSLSVDVESAAGIMTLQLPGDDRLIHVAAESMTLQAGADRLRIA